MSRKSSKSIANRKLAAALRARKLTPNGQTWADAKALVNEGVTPKRAASVIAALHAQEPELAALRERVVSAPVSQTSDPKRKLSSRAKEVRQGKVLRDAKGRLVSREVQQALELVNG